MKTKLITALRTCAKALEQGTFAYEWSQPESCNCGVVACALMGKSIMEMKKIIMPLRKQCKFPNWESMVSAFCPVTGMPSIEVFRVLAESGMSQKDMVDLENLANPVVIARAKITKDTYWVVVEENKKQSFWDGFWGNEPVKVKKTVNKFYYTKKENAIKYMRAWADLLTEEGKLDTVSSEIEMKEQTNES